MKRLPQQSKTGASIESDQRGLVILQVRCPEASHPNGSLQGPQGKSLVTLDSKPYVKWQLPLNKKAKSGQCLAW